MIAGLGIARNLDLQLQCRFAVVIDEGRRDGTPAATQLNAPALRGAFE
jgi:hypothetical protein